MFTLAQLQELPGVDTTSEPFIWWLIESVGTDESYALDNRESPLSDRYKDLSITGIVLARLAQSHLSN